MRQTWLTILAGLLITATPLQAAEINKISIGQHSTYTRLVVRLDEASSYSVDRSNTQQARLTLKDVAAAGPDMPLNADHAPLSSLSYETTQNGVALDIAFQSVKEIKSFDLPPDENGGHRIVLDFILGEPSQASSQDMAVTREALPPVAAAPLPPTLAPTIESPPETMRTTVPPTEEVPDSNTPIVAFDPTVTGSIPKSVDPCFKTTRQLEKDSWDLLVLVNHGVCLEENGKLSEARGTFERVLTFDPSIHGARLGLASVLTKLGKPEAAREAYLYILKSNPPDGVVQMIETRMSTLDVVTVDEGGL